MLAYIIPVPKYAITRATFATAKLITNAYHVALVTFENLSAVSVNARMVITMTAPKSAKVFCTKILVCHYTCHRCTGPTEFECSSCGALTLNFRVLKPSTLECACADGYGWVLNQKKCVGNRSLKIIVCEPFCVKCNKPNECTACSDS